MDLSKLTWKEFWFKLGVKMHNWRYKRDWGRIPAEEYFSRYASWRYAKRRPHASGTAKDGHVNFLAARPNPGAGIGHQMANWIAGYHFAKQFGLRFAHIPFSGEHHPLEANRWDHFLGFGEGETAYSDLLRQRWKSVLLPSFSEDDPQQIARIEQIVRAYADQKAVFLCEQDQFLTDQYLESDDLKRKFRQASARSEDQLTYDAQHFNIAIHVRRVVVIDGKTIQETEEQHARRWLSNDYYERVLQQVLQAIRPTRPIAIHIFSTGKAEEFDAFRQYGDVHFCNDMDEYQSFAHLIFADLLITSKSSFSYKPALMNSCTKVCPRQFWHGYPQAPDWVLCENDGTIAESELEKLRSVN